MPMNKRLTLIISGDVQGVGYRYHSSREAQKRGFFGFVANMPDDTVKIVAEGPEEDLKNFVTWCYNGVRSATVSDIIQQWSSPTGEFSDFVIKS